MKKLILITMALSSLLMADYSYSNSGAKEAFKDLDCEFEDCSPKEQKVQIVEKRVVVREVIKEVPVEKIVEKIVYRNRPVAVVKKTMPKKEVSIEGITLHKAYFDIYTNTQAPILDYITYTSRASFDVNFLQIVLVRLKKKI